MMCNNSEARRDSWDGMSRVGNVVDRGSRKKGAHGLRSQLSPGSLTSARESQVRELADSQEEVLGGARVLGGVVELHMADPLEKLLLGVWLAEKMLDQVLLSL